MAQLYNGKTVSIKATLLALVVNLLALYLSRHLCQPLKKPICLTHYSNTHTALYRIRCFVVYEALFKLPNYILSLIQKPDLI